MYLAPDAASISKFPTRLEKSFDAVSNPGTLSIKGWPKLFPIMHGTTITEVLDCIYIYIYNIHIKMFFNCEMKFSSRSFNLLEKVKLY